MSLPQKLPFQLLVTAWAKQLDPILANPILSGFAIEGIILNASTPKQIQTGLNRMQQGWIITDKLSNATVWRTQPLNSTSLTLEASADTTISIWVY
jgi:hypothetical protein